MLHSRFSTRRPPLSLLAVAGPVLVAGCRTAVEQPASDKPAHAAFAPFEIEIPGSTATLTMIPIPAGSVAVADAAAPGGQRTLAAGPFWMSQTEVTWDLFDVYVYRLDESDPSKPTDADAVSRPSKPYLPPDRGFGHAGYPAISIAHDSAVQFCTWLSAKTGRHFRLATEAEWELACRGDGKPDAASIDERAWHAGNAEGKTHPVGEKQPNSLGLYDMLGNVAEWTEGLDGKPTTSGGSYTSAPESLSCQTRNPYSRTWQSRDPQIPKSKWWLSDGPFVGFRIVCDPPEAVSQTPATK